MGCVQSSPADAEHCVDARLPIKPHLRQSFASAVTAGREQKDSQPGRPVGREALAPLHDIVLLHGSTGTAWATALGAALTQQQGVTLWSSLDQQAPVGSKTGNGTAHFSRPSVVAPGSGDEILPCKGEPGAKPTSALGSAGGPMDITPAQLVTAVSRSALGVIVVVTAGSTWDDGLLTCLRHSCLKDRPLVLVHVPESCPAPNTSDWPADVQQHLISRNIPMHTFLSSYPAHGSEQALSALRAQQRTLHGASVPSAPATATAHVTVAASSTAAPACGEEVTAGKSSPKASAAVCAQRISLESKPSPALTHSASSSATLTLGDSSQAVDVSASTGANGLGSGAASSLVSTPVSGGGLVLACTAGQGDKRADGRAGETLGWAAMQELLSLRLQQLADEGSSGRDSPDLLPVGVPAAVPVPQPRVLTGCPAPYDAVIGLHHPQAAHAVLGVARALAPYLRVLVIDGTARLGALEPTASRRGNALPLETRDSAPIPTHGSAVSPVDVEVTVDGASTTVAPPRQMRSRQAGSSASSGGAPPGPHLIPVMSLLPGMHLPSAAAGVASTLLGQEGRVSAGLPGGVKLSTGARHARSISVGADMHPSLLAAFRPHAGAPLQGSIDEEGLDATNGGTCVNWVSSVSGDARAALAPGACRHYVLFPGFNLGTASPLAVSEVQTALQGGSSLHVVCEASFNLVRPDLDQWPLAPGHLAALSRAWDHRLLHYHDHMEPLLAALAQRLVTSEKQAAGAAAQAKQGPASALGSAGTPGAESEIAGAGQPGSMDGITRQQGRPLVLSREALDAADGVVGPPPPASVIGDIAAARRKSGGAGLLRAASDMTGIQGVADLCLQLTQSQAPSGEGVRPSAGAASGVTLSSLSSRNDRSARDIVAQLQAPPARAG